jgi:hypothetical protein
MAARDVLAGRCGTKGIMGVSRMLQAARRRKSTGFLHVRIVVSVHGASPGNFPRKSEDVVC